PVLPATLDTEAEVLLLRRPGERPDQIKLVRLWRAPVQLADGGPLWVGTTQVLHFAEPFGLFGLWLPDPDTGVAHDDVRTAMDGVAMEQAPHPHTGVEVLRLRTDVGTDAGADGQDIMPSNCSRRACGSSSCSSDCRCPSDSGSSSASRQPIQAASSSRADGARACSPPTCSRMRSSS